MLTHLRAAQKDMRLTPAEQDLYKRHLTNLWTPSGVDNPEGSRSTLYQMVEQGPDGRFYNLPTVWDGAILAPDEALQKVDETGWDKFPAYKTPEEADARYRQMHDYMDRDTTDWMAVRGAASPTMFHKVCLTEGCPIARQYSDDPARIKISELPVATAASATDQLEANQSGTSRSSPSTKSAPLWRRAGAPATCCRSTASMA